MSDDFIVQLNVCDERFSPLSDTAVCSTVLAFLGSWEKIFFLLTVFRCPGLSFHSFRCIPCNNELFETDFGSLLS